MKLNPLCWLQIVSKVGYGCSIRVPEFSIRVYRSFIAIIIVRHCFSLIMPVICHSYKLCSFVRLIKPFSLINYSYRPAAVIKLCPQPTYYSGIILAKLVTYYSFNYASIIGAGLIGGVVGATL